MRPDIAFGLNRPSTLLAKKSLTTTKNRKNIITCSRNPVRAHFTGAAVGGGGSSRRLSRETESDIAEASYIQQAIYSKLFTASYKS
jgi:hypothetical protein